MRGTTGRTRGARVAAAALAAAVLSTAAIGEPALRPDDAALTALGAEIYDRECAACHGAELEGQTPDWRRRDADGYLPAPPHDASGHTWHHPDAMLFAMTKYGLAPLAGPEHPSRMPAFEGLLTDGEILAALSFIKSTWPEQVRRRHDAINARSAR